MTTTLFSPKEKMQVANIMLSQLGGFMFIKMTGSKLEKIYERDYKIVIRLKVGRNGHRINRLEMSYNETQDLYELSFIRNAKGVDKVVKEYTEVYSDMLSYLFENVTGLRTSII